MCYLSSKNYKMMIVLVGCHTMFNNGKGNEMQTMEKCLANNMA